MNSNPAAATISLAFVAALAFGATSFVPTEARAQLAPQEARCQADLAKTARKYLERVLKYRIRCQNKVITGDLPLATDCLSGTGDEALTKQLLKAQARLSVSGTDCNGVNLQLLGFPNLCENQSGPFDTADFKECVLDRTEAILDELLDYYYPPLFERQRGDIALCLQGTPQDAMDSLIGKIRAREKCLIGQAYGKIDEDDVNCYEKILPYGAGTGDEKTDDSLSRAYVELLGTIPKACAVTNINDLDYQDKCEDPTGGNFNIFDLKNCLFAADRVATLEVLGTVFPTEAICGDGQQQGDEECDNGVGGNSDTTPNACRTDCTDPGCGDGVRDNGPPNNEACDDGNSSQTDACLNTCVAASCGDGFVRTGVEQCDNGSQNANAADKCRATGPHACRNPRCGDGIQDTGEECDDSNTTSEDLCSSICDVEFCGDDIVQDGLGEECDNGSDNGTDPDDCRPDGHPFECKDAFCGDGIKDSSEGCDDGNTNNTDACKNDCTPTIIAVCGNGVVEVPEECDDGTTLNSDTTPNACRTNCKDPRCGDNVTDAGETCDDGNTNNGDACRNDCHFCGDATVQGPGEECDDGTTLNSNSVPDACRTNCKDPRCGDGVSDPSNGEACDDGNSIETDSCRTDCHFCGDGSKQASEDCDGSDAPCPGGNCSECGCVATCPTEGELILFAGVGRECSNNADCPVGVCDTMIGACRTVTRLDSGWIGLGHGADINDEVVTRGFLECDGHGPTCGECDIKGIDPQTDTCRCQNDTRRVCDEKFATNTPQCPACANNAAACTTNADCPGSTCTATTGCRCYFGAPFPLSADGTPVCVSNRFSADVSGTANVDLGAGAIDAKLRTSVYLGLNQQFPCPVCGGRCSNSNTTFCVRDQDCPIGGTCDDDDLPNDGNREGTCSFGPMVPNYLSADQGQPCDNMAFNSSFPVFPTGPSGGWYSLDCGLDVGKITSGQGLVINLTQKTGPVSLSANVSCGGLSPDLDCPCLACSNDSSLPCNTDAECLASPSTCSLGTGGNPAKCTTNTDCASASGGNCSPNTLKCLSAASKSCATNADCQNINLGTCRVPTCSSIGAFGTNALPNLCDGMACSDLGGGLSECTTGPDKMFCGGLVRANGKGLLPCENDDACAPGVYGVEARPCNIIERAKCFSDPITAEGVADPETPIGASVFCIPPTSNSGVNSAAGLPGPGRVVNQAKARTFCGNDTSKQYIPGVGGCLD